ncbi:MAG TPA: response regulator [Verrucomicrobiae bacterium]|jgi:CheY-like chemotaxis protein|nr:response regulator [Verrucomicrobiae bacterium]
MKSVLIIDDKEEVRSVVKATLTQFGFATHEASDGREGIQKALMHLPDLILCDVNMNGMDGFRTIEAIRELSLFAATPIILMTGSVGHEGFRRGMNLGADDFLQKPFQPDDLIEAVVSRLVRNAELQALAQKRAERLRDEAVLQISEELTAPINGILGAVSTLRREAPSLQTEYVFASACRLNESVVRLGQMATAHAHE